MTGKKALPGVYPAKKKDGTEYYRASMTYKGKHISLGSYESMFDAHLAYTDAIKTMGDSGIAVGDFDKINPNLKFDKWVSIAESRCKSAQCMSFNLLFGYSVFLSPIIIKIASRIGLISNVHSTSYSFFFNFNFSLELDAL